MVLAPGGVQVYHDQPRGVKSFFRSLGVELPKYKNPADELLKFANSPENLERLKDVETGVVEDPSLDLTLNKGLISNPVNRRANFCQQVYHLGKRNL
jgi:hypothetical protein